MSESEKELAHVQLVVRDITDALGIELDERQARLIASIVLRARREARHDQLASLRSQLDRIEALVKAVKP